MALCGLRWRAGGAATGLALWMGLPAFLFPPARYGYPRKRSRRIHQIFLAYAVCVSVMGGLYGTICHVCALTRQPSFLSDMLSLTGAIGCSLPIGKRALSLPLPRWFAWGLGALLCALFLVFLIFQTPRI